MEVRVFPSAPQVLVSPFPKIDVIIPSRNGMPYLPQAVESVLAQSYSQLSVCVVDGESPDESITYLKSVNDSRLRWYSTPKDWTPAARRNFGVSRTSGELLVFLDSDDLLEPSGLAELCSALTVPQQGIAVGGIRRFYQRGTSPSDESSPNIEYGPAIGNVLMSRQVFAQVGNLNEALVVGEFVEWMTRARNVGVKELLTSTLVLHRREHDRNRSRLLKGAYGIDYPQILREHLQRKRNTE